jgi:VPDSG-CTERM motif
MRKVTTLLLALALAAPTICRAGVVFIPGNNPQPGEENVLLNNGTTGSTVSGITNQTGFVVDFSSLTQTLSEPSSGQARIEATANGAQVALSDVSFGLATGTFTDAIFNMFIGGTIGTPGGSTITALTNDGTFQFNLDLGNGQNFLTIVATGGEFIENISISAAQPGFTDLRQVRISGATASTVPDSGSTLALLGSGVSALALLRRKLVFSDR